MSEFGRANDLRDELNRLIEVHGDDVRVAFCLSDEDAGILTGSAVGPIRVDSVELTTPPRIDLEFVPTK